MSVPLVFRGLGFVQSAAAQAIWQSDAHPLHAQLAELLENEAFGALSHNTQMALVSVLLATVQDTEAGVVPPLDLPALLSPSFARLAAHQQLQAIDVFTHCTSEMRQDFLSLLRTGTALAKDSQQQMLLETLANIASQPTDPALRLFDVSTTDALRDLMHDLVTPFALTQGQKNTCTVTSMQFLIMTRQPAEYARLVAGLLSPAAMVSFANGEMLRRVVDSVEEDGSERTLTGRLFQAAMMQFAVGESRYSNTTDDSGRLWLRGIDRHSGLNPWQERNAMKALFNRDFDWTLRLSRMLEAPLPQLLSLRWQGSFHAVVVTSITQGRVYFRNPWGPQPGVPNGTLELDPARRMERNDLGMESMSTDDFLRTFAEAIVPD